MKLMKVMTLCAAVGALSSLHAQQPADLGTTLDAIVVPTNAKKPVAARLLRPAAVSKGGLRMLVLNRSVDEEPRDLTTKDLKTLLIMTPPDLATAQRTYAEGSLSSAKKQLAAVRTKYADFAGLPDSPAVKAALLELRCLARMQDWEALGKAVEDFPYPRFQEASDRAVLDAARVLSQVSDDPATAADRLKMVDDLMTNTGKMKLLHSTEYGWLKYAQARALASGTPDKAKASQAVDAFCEAAVCYRGGEMELAEDAMKRAFHLLWSMPGVKEYLPTAKKMDVKKWESAPADFRDAVALANMILFVVNPDVKDDAVRQAAKYFVNAQEGKKPAAAPQQK